MEINRFIEEALAEDIGDGDHTTISTIPTDRTDTAELLVKENGILSGMQLAESIIKRVDPVLQWHPFNQDGDKIRKGQIAFTINGPTHSILKLERLVLNCLQRMSGIATITKSYVEEVIGTGAVILDTRKTTPLLRPFEKAAVRHGGGQNHRSGLYDMILIKDNHVDAAGGITQALERAFEYRHKNNLQLKIEIESRNIDDVKAVLKAGKADRVMFDNFSPEQVGEAVGIVKGSIETEASGGITLENIRKYALTGVDYISVGALTHSVKSLDLSLKIRK